MSSQHNSSSSDTTAFIRVVLFVVVLIATVCAVVYLKRSSDLPLTPEGVAARDSLRRIAHPDTTVSPGSVPADAAGTVEYPSDSVTMDLRVPSDAGYEDGYYAGITDGSDRTKPIRSFGASITNR